MDTTGSMVLIREAEKKLGSHLVRHSYDLLEKGDPGYEKSYHKFHKWAEGQATKELKKSLKTA